MAASPDTVSFDPSRRDYTPYGLTCVKWRPSRMQRPDHHNEVELNYLVTGSVTYLLGGRKVTVPAGHLSVFWAAVPHQIIDYGEGSSYFVATIPFAWFLQWRLPACIMTPLLAGELIIEPSGRKLDLDAHSFAQWEADLAGRKASLHSSVLLEMQARLLRLAAGIAERKTRKVRYDHKVSGLSKVERMACFVAQHYLDKLTVARIAKVAGLHPNYAMNLFQKTLGTTLVDYVTQHRVSHAQRLLATTDAKINDVASDSGFHSISRFNFAFREVCGCSPREYRRLNRQEEPG